MEVSAGFNASKYEGTHLDYGNTNTMCKLNTYQASASRSGIVENQLRASSITGNLGTVTVTVTVTVTDHLF
jgi:hypothetical protein